MARLLCCIGYHPAPTRWGSEWRRLPFSYRAGVPGDDTGWGISGTWGTPRQLYGFLAAPIREHLAIGVDVILTIDPQGAQTIRRLTKGSIAIFVIPKSLDQLVEQLNRGDQNTAEQRSRQLINARRELAHLSEYDYVIVAHAHFVWSLDQALRRTRERRSSKRARPYICLFSNFRRVICPST